MTLGLELVRSARAEIGRRIAGTPVQQSASQGCGLSFPSPGGPVVVVVGLHGGAGASTLAFALAAQAAQESSAPVLLCETDATAGDIGYVSGVRSELSLAELALAVQQNSVPEGGGHTLAGRLRVIAGDPKPAQASDEAIADLVVQARRAHGLTVVDVGPVRSSLACELISVATHVVWVTAARDGAASRAERMLGFCPLSVPGRQVLVVRGLVRGWTVRGELKGLRMVAEQCCDRLLMMTHSSGVNGHVDLSERKIQDALTGLGGFLAA